MKILTGISKEFEMCVCVHQVSAPSPWLLGLVMEEKTTRMQKGLPLGAAI